MIAYITPSKGTATSSLSTNLNGIDWGQETAWDGKDNSKADWNNRVTLLSPASPSSCPPCSLREKEINVKIPDILIVFTSGGGQCVTGLPSRQAVGRRNC